MKIAIVVYKTQVMEEPLHAKLRPVERATRRTFIERENPMNDQVAGMVSKAIADQQATRTPAPDRGESEKEGRSVVRLDFNQRNELKAWLNSDEVRGWIVGKSPEFMAMQFNDSIVPFSSNFQEKRRGIRVTHSHVRGFLPELGYGVLSGAIVVVRNAVLAPLAPTPEVTPRPFLADGVEAVTMYRGQSGILYDSIEAASASYQTELIAGVVYRVGRTWDEKFEHKFAFEIATALVSTYNISPK